MVDKISVLLRLGTLGIGVCSSTMSVKSELAGDGSRFRLRVGISCIALVDWAAICSVTRNDLLTTAKLASRWRPRTSRITAFSIVFWSFWSLFLGNLAYLCGSWRRLWLGSVNVDNLFFVHG